MFTIGNWILFVFIAICGFVPAIIAFSEDEKLTGVVIILITIIVLAVLMGSIAWYHTSTEKGQRVMKDFNSNVNGGLEREITIIAEDGREIFHYEGKIDIEADHTDNYILFESEQGKRYMIYYGIQDTVLIIEK